MLHKILTVCMYFFTVYCIFIFFAWVYEILTVGFAWREAAVYARSFLIFSALAVFSYRAVYPYK